MAKPKNAPNAMTVRGSMRMALLSSASKYRTSPALDIRPPPSLLLMFTRVRAVGLSLSSSFALSSCGPPAAVGNQSGNHGFGVVWASCQQ